MARKRGMQYIPYDYEAAYNKAMEDMHEWFIENLFQHRKKVIYALKEITAGDQFEIEIYPQFRSMDEVPPEGRTIKKDNNKAQKNLNDKNARKYVERLINENCYTGNLRAALKAAGFEVLTESKYLTSDAYLFAGDILLNDNAHVATNLTTGSKASGTSAPSKSINEVAKEVINGKWGNGSDRTNRLAAAGYDAKAVQNEVNRILR